MGKCTKEPWAIREDDWNDFEHTIMAGQKRIAEVKHFNDGKDNGFPNDPMFEEGEANAARIVACVNACEGMEDPAKEIEDLKSAQIELVAALKTCIASLCTYGSHPIIEKQVRVALLKGGQQ